MQRRRGNRRVAVCLLVSAAVHLLGLWLVWVLMPPEVEERLFRVRLPTYMPRLAERFRPRPAVPVSRELLERLRAEAVPAAVEIEVGGEMEGGLPEIEMPRLDEGWPEEVAGEKGEWVAAEDTLPDASLGLLEQTGELPLALDLVELDAEAREQTVVIVDPETGKLKRAYWHLPVYMGFRDIAEALNLIRRGFRLPGAVPVFSQIHWFRLGEDIPDKIALMKIEGFPDPDPIHGFYRHPQRHILHHTEMAEYPVILLNYIDVESTSAMVQYLINGGFAVVDPQRQGLLEREMRRRVGERLERVRIELGHPLFHSFYDIDKLCCRSPECGPPCPLVCPVSGLQLDGRLVAVASPPFTLDKSCPANRLYVNIVAYALVQPSPMGGRYLAREKD